MSEEPEYSVEQARASVQRLINSHFHNKDRARCSIPANAYDDDLVASRYVTQSADKIAALQAEVARIKAWEQEQRERYDSAVTLLTTERDSLRKQLDELLSHKLNNDPSKVEWHSAKTVGHLRMQLETIDPSTPVAAVYFIKIGDVVEARVTGIQLSWESINNERNRIDKNGTRGLALWAHENDGFGPEVLAYLGRAEELLLAKGIELTAARLYFENQDLKKQLEQERT